MKSITSLYIDRFATKNKVTTIEVDSWTVHISSNGDFLCEIDSFAYWLERVFGKRSYANTLEAAMIDQKSEVSISAFAELWEEWEDDCKKWHEKNAIHIQNSLEQYLEEEKEIARDAAADMKMDDEQMRKAGLED